MDQPPTRHRTVKVLFGLVLGLLILGYGVYLVLPWASNITLAYWWFVSLHLSQIFTTRLTAQVNLGLMVFVISLLFFGWFAHRLRQIFATKYPPSNLGRWLGYFLVLIASLMVSYLISHQYLTFLLWRSHSSFNQTEPIFHASYDFYIYTLPFLHLWTDLFAMLISVTLLILGLYWLVIHIQTTKPTSVTVHHGPNFARTFSLGVAVLFFLPFLAGIFMASGAGAAAFPLAVMLIGGFIYYKLKKNPFQTGWSVFNSSRATPSGESPTDLGEIGKLVGQLLGLLLIVLAVTSYLGRYGLVFGGGSDILPTASWLDVVITAKYLVVRAAFFLIWGLALLLGRLPAKTHAVIFGSLVILTLIGQLAIPGLLRSLYVKPNELTLESPYISDHINATRFGFNLDHITELPYQPHASLTGEDLASSPDTLANIRVWDYRAFETANNQLQALRTFYSFDDADIDRYPINGQKRELLVSARELHLSQLPASSGSQWIIPLTYTHSYGLTAAQANLATLQGQPDYLLKDIPPVALDQTVAITNPDMYFSEAPLSNIFLNTGLREVDPSLDVTAGQTLGTPTESVSTRESSIGIPIDTFGKRLMAAFHHGFSANVLFSKFISTGQTTYVVNRSLQTRLAALAPFLTWDSDPYPVVRASGEIVWLIDGYTTTTELPLAARVGDSQTNYQRNAVKATVNAATGETHLYLWDATDPLIQSWQGIFPQLFESAADLPTDLLTHVRYPVDLFKLQTEVYNRYHVSDPLAFYSHEDVWRVPDEVLAQGGSATPMDAYYNIVNLPGLATKTGEFTLLRPAAPFSKDNMTAMFAGRSDAPNTGQLVVYRLPTTTLVAGPSQIATRIDQDPELSKTFSLWNQEGSQVIRGGMYVLPVGQTMLYVQPIYLQARNNPIPELRLVVLATDNQLVFAPTAQEALAKLIITQN